MTIQQHHLQTMNGENDNNSNQETGSEDPSNVAETPGAETTTTTTTTTTMEEAPKRPFPIHNPYANKRSRFSLETTMSNVETEKTIEIAKKVVENPYNKQLLPEKRDEYSNKSDNHANNENEKSSALPLQQQQPATMPSKPIPQSSLTPATSFWERLPSRNVSFGSAEILTVTECIQHAALYQNRAIRVTGLLHQRRFLPGANDDDELIVQLELLDPLTIPTHPSSSGRQRHSTSQRPSLAGRSSSTGLLKPSSTPKSSSLSNNNHRLSTAAKSPATLLGPSSSSSLSTRTQSKPWFANTGSKGRPSSSSSSSLGGILRSRPSSATKPPPRVNLLKVMVDPSMPRLDQAVVGSMVMVIGTIVQVQQQQQEHTNNAEVTKEKDSISDSVPLSNRRNNDSTLPPPPIYYKLEARILQILPQADLTMFGAALQARRKALYLRYYHHHHQNVSEEVGSANDNDGGGGDTAGLPLSLPLLQTQFSNHPQSEEQAPTDTTTTVGTGSATGNQSTTSSSSSSSSSVLVVVVVPLPGCGPPPYDKFLHY
jgi:hypothetical protein